MNKMRYTFPRLYVGKSLSGINRLRESQADKLRKLIIKHYKLGRQCVFICISKIESLLCTGNKKIGKENY